MGLKTVHGDIVETKSKSLHFAINSDPDDTIWIPISVVKEGLDEAIAEEDLDDIDLLVESWWYNLYSERFE